MDRVRIAGTCSFTGFRPISRDYRHKMTVTQKTRRCISEFSSKLVVTRYGIIDLYNDAHHQFAFNVSGRAKHLGLVATRRFGGHREFGHAFAQDFSHGFNVRWKYHVEVVAGHQVHLDIRRELSPP